MTIHFRTGTDYLVVHCSATRASQDIDAATIRKWHMDKGWYDIGYHFVIKRDGTRDTGRKVNAIGSHVQGYNARAVGICLIGGVADDGIEPENNFTPAQFVTLRALLLDLRPKFPKAKIQGHRDFPNVHKACPSFDVSAWLKEVGL